MIEIKNLTKKFKTSHGILEVFNDFSLTVKDGTFLGIQGKSGAGKSTLLTLLAGLQPADNGSIKVGEIEITKISQSALAAFRNQNIGFISQEQSFLENLNVLDNVRLPAYLAKKHLGQKVSDNEISQRAKQLLSDLGISHLATQYPSDLSGGENHRLLIARALINNPQVLLADEPTDSVDQERTQEILKIFRNLASQGKIVILVSHDQQALSLCDCVVNI